MIGRTIHSIEFEISFCLLGRGVFILHGIGHVICCVTWTPPKVFVWCGHDMGTSTGTCIGTGDGIGHNNLVEHEPKCSKIGVSVSCPFKDPCRVCRVHVT